jgi:hypothetical protein
MFMRRFWPCLSTALTLVVASTITAHAQNSRCGDCHLSRLDAPYPSHVRAWASSVHRNIGCEACHGGNPGSLESLRAHQGVLFSQNVNSLTHRRNLPETCGACHAAPLASFKASRHYELLKTGNDRGPTCSTCHSDVDGRLLSAKALASECDACHGPRERAPRPERARQVREQYESLSVVRQELKLADSIIKRIDDRGRRTKLREMFDLVQDPLNRAIAAGHQFVYEDMQDYLARAQQRVQTLLDSLVNR